MNDSIFSGAHLSAWKRPNFFVFFLTSSRLLIGVTLTIFTNYCPEMGRKQARQQKATGGGLRLAPHHQPHSSIPPFQGTVATSHTAAHCITIICTTQPPRDTGPEGEWHSWEESHERWPTTANLAGDSPPVFDHCSLPFPIIYANLG